MFTLPTVGWRKRIAFMLVLLSACSMRHGCQLCAKWLRNTDDDVTPMIAYRIATKECVCVPERAPTGWQNDKFDNLPIDMEIKDEWAIYFSRMLSQREASSVRSASFLNFAIADSIDSHLRNLITTAATPRSRRRTFTNSSLCAERMQTEMRYFCLAVVFDASIYTLRISLYGVHEY